MPSDASATAVSAEALEADLFNHLETTSALEELHENLLFTLQRAGWTERVRNLSVELLRAGRCEHFDDVVDAVVALAQGSTHPAITPPDDGANGVTRDPDVDAFFENVDIRIPGSVVEQGAKSIKEALRPIVEIEDDGEATDGEGGKPSQPEGCSSTPVKKPAPTEGKPEKKAGKTNKDPSAPRLKNGEVSSAKKPAKDKKSKTAAKDVKTGG